MSDYWQDIEDIVRREVPPDENTFQYVFLVGAGASKSSGIPDGKQMSESLKEEYEITDEDIERRRIVYPGLASYQAIMSLIQDKKSEFWISRYIRGLIRKARRPQPDSRWIINNCYDTLANILLEKPRFSRVVLTTNFDPLLYYAFIQNWHDEPVLIRHADEVATMKPTEVFGEFPALLYLHGYWQNHSQYNQPGQIADYNKGWHGRLETFTKHDVIVVGYSGLEDSVAMGWLSECLKPPHANRIWWCVYSPDRQLKFQQVEPIQKALNNYVGDRLRFIPIASADEFLLDLGTKLGLKRATDIACAFRAFPWFRPSALSHFANGASLDYQAGQNFDIEIHTGNDLFPGNNHAGINIDTIVYEMDLTGYDAIRVHYTVEKSKVPKKAAGFEFKLHSDRNAWSYHLPFEPEGGSHTIPLRKYTDQDVNLSRIWRIVIAADVKCLGKNGRANISISKTELIKS